jgi:hypothetical protein
MRGERRVDKVRAGSAINSHSSVFIRTMKEVCFINTHFIIHHVLFHLESLLIFSKKDKNRTFVRQRHGERTSILGHLHCASHFHIDRKLFLSLTAL